MVRLGCLTEHAAAAQSGQVTVQVVQVANSVPPDRGEMVWTGMGWGICQAANHPSGLARQGLLWPVGSPSQANQAAAVVVCNSRRSLSAACFPALPDRRLAQTRATCSEAFIRLGMPAIYPRLPICLWRRASRAPVLQCSKKGFLPGLETCVDGCVRSGLADHHAPAATASPVGLQQPEEHRRVATRWVAAVQLRNGP